MFKPGDQVRTKTIVDMVNGIALSDKRLTLNTDVGVDWLCIDTEGRAYIFNEVDLMPIVKPDINLQLPRLHHEIILNELADAWASGPAASTDAALVSALEYIDEVAEFHRGRNR